MEGPGRIVKSFIAYTSHASDYLSYAREERKAMTIWEQLPAKVFNIKLLSSLPCLSIWNGNQLFLTLESLTEMNTIILKFRKDKGN